MIIYHSANMSVKLIIYFFSYLLFKLKTGNINQMGQSNQSTSLKHQWQYVDTFGRFQVYKNELNQLAEKHITKSNPKIQQSTYFEIYNQRNHPTQPIVSVFDASFSQQDNDICRHSSTFTVFTQYIPYRLSNLNKLTQGQSMYVLSEALAGFSWLYNKMGPFQINDDLIGFNKDGEVKVWHNANFADNSIQNDKVILMSTRNPYNFDTKFIQNQQIDIVEDVFVSVAKYSNFDNSFLADLQNIQGFRFNQARQIISNQINRKKYYVPDHINVKGNDSMLEKSGIKSKHSKVEQQGFRVGYQGFRGEKQSSRMRKDSSKIDQQNEININRRQNYPFFTNNQTQQYQQRFPINEEYLIDQFQGMDESKHRLSQLQIIPQQVTSHHLIPSRRGVTYTTQESIVHHLPAVRQDYYNENSPKILHRHKMLQEETARLVS